MPSLFPLNKSVSAAEQAYRDFLTDLEKCLNINILAFGLHENLFLLLVHNMKYVVFVLFIPHISM